MYNVTFNDSDCYTFKPVTEFAGDFSILDGKGRAAFFEAFGAGQKVSWFEARVPFSGEYGLCYTMDGDNVSTNNWRALSGLTLHAFGNSEAKIKYHCAAELNQSCTIRVNSLEPTARLRLLNLDGKCGYDGNEPTPQPFLQKTSVVTIQQTHGDHSFGQYGEYLALQPGMLGIPNTFRICFCHAYEYDVASDGNGACLSSGSVDFPQSLGYLYLVVVTTDPVYVYQGLRHTVRIKCGVAGTDGCNLDFGVRIRFIDLGQDGTFGQGGPSDLCRSQPETSSYASPANCVNKDMRLCKLPPSVVIQGVPSWYSILFQGNNFNRLSKAQKLGVCFCSGNVGCQSGSHWLLAEVSSLIPSWFSQILSLWAFLPH
jgi:hypothetical protein